MEKVSGFVREDEQMELPPGFRFHPTDEELITYYLSPKVHDSDFCAVAIGEVDLNKVEPWDLPWKAKLGEKEWYFFCVRDRKYPTGLRTNRATEAGYWKATGKDKEIYKDSALVGMKKTLVFYKGRAPKGEKTNWVMHEYRLEGKYSSTNLPKTAKNEWVICRIFKKSSGGKKVHISGLLRTSMNGDEDSESSELPPLMDVSPSYIGEASHSHVTCFSDSMEDQKPQPSLINHHVPSSSSSMTHNFTPSSFVLPKIHPPNHPFFQNQFMPSFNSFQYTDSIGSMQDESILRLLLDNSMSYEKSDVKTEYSGVSTDISPAVSNHEVGLPGPYVDGDFPINSSSAAGPVDLDCLWNY